jgi:endonuclease YncB( thermonuclease family)
LDFAGRGAIDPEAVYPHLMRRRFLGVMTVRSRAERAALRMVELNRELVRQGWALAWYPERGAVPGPVYDAEQLEAEQAQRQL